MGNHEIDFKAEKTSDQTNNQTSKGLKAIRNSVYNGGSVNKPSDQTGSGNENTMNANTPHLEPVSYQGERLVGSISNNGVTNLDPLYNNGIIYDDERPGPAERPTVVPPYPLPPYPQST